MARGSIRITSLFKQKGSEFWYFRFTDKSGKRRKRSTGKKKQGDAFRVAQAYIERMTTGEDDTKTLRNALIPFSNPETNPRYRQAKLTGGKYTKNYAINFAYATKRLITFLDGLKRQSFLDIPMVDFDRPMLRELREELVKGFGLCKSAQWYFQIIKVAFTQALDDGWILHSTAAGMDNIKYDEQKKLAIPPERLAWLISRKDLFFGDEEFRLWFTFAATTGMRLSEIIGMTEDRINDSVLTIDRQRIATDKKFVHPKCNVIRVIPLSKIAQEAVAEMHPKKGRLIFNMSHTVIEDRFKTLRCILQVADPEMADLWARMTPHVLRHSMNSNLLIDGQNILLVGEYLAWRHQTLSDIQQRYTHFTAMNLKPIADAIDRLYTPVKTSNKMLSFHG